MRESFPCNSRGCTSVVRDNFPLPVFFFMYPLLLTYVLTHFSYFSPNDRDIAEDRGSSLSLFENPILGAFLFLFPFFFFSFFLSFCVNLCEFKITRRHHVMAPSTSCPRHFPRFLRATRSGKTTPRAFFGYLRGQGTYISHPPLPSPARVLVLLRRIILRSCLS